MNSYSHGGRDFVWLLSEIAKLKKKFRLRFMTSNPKDFDERLIEAVSSYPNICKHMHLPAQSGSNRVLSLMNRKYTRERYISLTRSIKENIKDSLISTDLMVGFPTETEEDFLETLSLVRECRFSQAFTFVYSPRSGTVSANLPDLPADVKKRRITELIRAQNKVTKEISETFLGKTSELLVEDTDKDGRFTGRTDNGRLVSFEKNDGVKIGDFVDVRIVGAKSASLSGELLRINRTN